MCAYAGGKGYLQQQHSNRGLYAFSLPRGAVADSKVFVCSLFVVIKIRKQRKKRKQKRQANRNVHCDELSQASADNIQTPFSRRCPPTSGNLLRDGFGFGSILSGAAPSSAVVAQHDRQLEQIVHDDMLSAARQTRCSRPRITRVPSSPMMAEKATAFGPDRTTREVAPCSLARSP